MNIYDFINSPDVAEYCQSIEHVFNSLEMAVIVALSRKTMKEKHAAWREIFTQYPDMPISERPRFSAQESLHGYLRELIAHEINVYKEFTMATTSVVYRPDCFRYFDSEKSFPVAFLGCFSTVEKVIKAVQQNLEGIKGTVRMIYIVKETIDGNEDFLPHNGVWFDYSGNPLYLDETFSKHSKDQLDSVSIHIPSTAFIELGQ
jgi:hypothetical protein